MLTEAEIKAYTVDIPADIQAAQRASGCASATLLACPTCGTQPETRGWQTYCPTCLLEAPAGEVPAECEANWNKMISGQANAEVSDRAGDGARS